MNSNLDIYMENQLYLSAPCFVLDEEKLYFSNRSCNALVIVDRETWNVESMVPFVEEDLKAKGLHVYCHRQGNKIYFLPEGKKKLHVYDVESGEQRAYTLEGEYEGSQAAPWYIHVYQDKLFLLPCGGKMGLWSLDFDGQLNKENWWEAQSKPYFFTHGDIDEQRFLSLNVLTSDLIITDLKNKESKTFKLPDEQVFQTVYDGQDFWYISGNNADIVKWNPEKGEVERYSFPIWDKCNPIGVPYLYIYAVGQEIFVVSGTQKELFLLDKEKRILKQVFQLPEYLNIYNEIEMLPELTYFNDKLIWTFRSVHGAAVIDLATMKGKMYQNVIPLNDKVRDCFDKILIQNAPLINEVDDGWDLERFLYYCENSI